MPNRLLELYDQELAVLRKQASEFGELYPKVASHLRLGASKNEDPQVALLTESIAFLNARLRLKLDEDFPLVCETMLNVLYPHFLAPIPSMSVVQFEAKEDVTPSPEGIIVPRNTNIETPPVQQVPCLFQTTQEVKVWPYKITNANFYRPPYSDEMIPLGKNYTSVLGITLTSSKIPFGDYLNFEPSFFWSGPVNIGQIVFSLILFQRKDVWCKTESGLIPISPDRIFQTCFDISSSMLPSSSRTFSGYRLLTEYFAFPEKFLFFSINLRQILSKAGNKIELLFGFDSTPGANIEKMVSPETIKTGCSPVANYFTKRAEPISLDKIKEEYCVIPEIRNKNAFLVHSIQEARLVTSSGSNQIIPPVFGFLPDGTNSNLGWSSIRKTPGTGDSGPLEAPQVYIQFIGAESEAIESGSILDIKTISTNGNYPTNLPFGGGEPKLTMVDQDPSLNSPTFMIPPSRPCHDHLGDKNEFRWKLVSHLLLNQVSLCEGPEAAGALKKLLTLYNFSNSSNNQKIINSIESVSSSPTIGKINGLLGGAVIQGIEILIEFNPNSSDIYSLLGFGSVLDRYFALYVDSCSFTRLAIKFSGSSDLIHRWPIKIGSKPVV